MVTIWGDHMGIIWGSYGDHMVIWGILWGSLMILSSTHLSNGSGFSELHVIGACVRRYFFSHQHCLLALLHFLNDLILPFIPEYHAPAVPHNLIIDVEVAVDDQDLKAFRDLLGWIE